MIYNKSLKKHSFDWILLIIVILLCSIGSILIFSSNYSKNIKTVEIYKQFLVLVPAVFAFIAVILVNYKRITKFIIPLYIINLIFLLIVLLKGHSAYGAQRWIHVMGFTFQPSELAKIVFIITLAYLLSKKKIEKIQDLFLIFVVILPPVLLIFKQPDLGTSMVFWGIFLGMLLAYDVSFTIIFVLISPFISMLFYSIGTYFWIGYILFLLIIIIFLYKKQNNPNYRWSFIKGLGVFVLNLLAGPAIGIVWNLLKDYQKTRIMIFLNPDIDPLGAGYHIIQSKIAIGSGGLFGKGFLQGTQTQLSFIPVQESDFIFSVIGEEFGFIGGVILLILYLIFIWRLLKIADTTTDKVGYLIVVGITSMFLFHVFVNLGMVSAIMPVVGIPLPFISYGGTSLLTNFIALGLVQSIAMHRKVTY